MNRYRCLLIAALALPMLLLAQEPPKAPAGEDDPRLPAEPMPAVDKVVPFASIQEYVKANAQDKILLYYTFYADDHGRVVKHGIYREFHDTAPGVAKVPDLKAMRADFASRADGQPGDTLALLDKPLATRDLATGGPLSREATYVNGRPHGRQRWWYPNGQLWMDFTTKMGVRDGTYQEYHLNGKLKARRTYRDGTLLRQD